MIRTPNQRNATARGLESYIALSVTQTSADALRDRSKHCDGSLQKQDLLQSHLQRRTTLVHRTSLTALA